MTHYKKNDFFKSQIKAYKQKHSVKKKVLYFYPIKKYHFLEPYLEFSDVEIEKKGFHSSKKAVDLDKMDIEKILVSNEFAHEKNPKKQMQDTSSGIKLVKQKLGPFYFQNY